MAQWLQPEIVFPVVLVLLGLAFWLGRRSGPSQQRIRVLEDDRELAQKELDQYKGRVADHFAETSERLHELTLQYRSVYDHLARGASDLCPEGFEKLEGGLGLDALAEEATPGTQPESENESLEEAAARFAEAGPAEAPPDAQPSAGGTRS